MKILFINPISNTHYKVPPIGLGYLATAVSQKHDVEIFDCQRRPTTHDDIGRKIRSFSPDITGIQAFSYDMPQVLKIVSLSRKIRKKSTVIVGGAHSSGVGKQILDHHRDIDYAFKGEAERGFSQLLSLLESGGGNLHSLESIPGLIWRQGDETRENPQDFPRDLDALGFPRWDLMDPRTYPLEPQGVFYRQAPIAPILTSRGCPFPCSFCAGKTLTGRKLRMRSIGHIMSEIDLLVQDYGVRELHIVDDTFTSDKKRVTEFCEELLRRDYKLTFTMPNGVRLDTLDKEMLALMKRAGCYALIVGIESGSQKILDHMRKGIRKELIEEKVLLIKSVGLAVRGFFIIGYPAETEKDIRDTIEFAKKLPLNGAHFSSFLPLPGTAITEQLLKEGEITEIPYNDLFYSKIPYCPKGMTKKTVKNLIRHAYLSFYLRPGVLWRMMAEIRTWRHLQQLIHRFFDYAFQRN